MVHILITDEKYCAKHIAPNNSFSFCSILKENFFLNTLNFINNYLSTYTIETATLKSELIHQVKFDNLNILIMLLVIVFDLFEF